jgi:periplasmic protein CpxP/Spy
MKIKCLGNVRLGLAIAALGLSGALVAGAQAPIDGPGTGMGPHRPPMERAMGPHGDHGRWWNEPHAIEKFKLTDSQRKSMDDVYQQHRMTLVDLHANLEKAELTMEPMMQEDQPDEGKILSQIDRVAAARAELEKANARMLFELRRQLTPEQWKQLQADRAAHRDGHGPEGAGARWHGQGRGQAGPGGQPGPGGPGGGSVPPPPGEQE